MPINPLTTNNFMDSCAFDPKYKPEDRASEEIFKLSKVGKILIQIAHSTQKEIDHPNTPGWVTLLLLFAAIDGLGKLIHDDDKAPPSKRIGVFLDYMGDNYRTCKKELLNLRNSLVHNAINVASFMSNDEIGSDKHLTTIGSTDFFYVNTKTMYQDFIRAFEGLREEFENDYAKLSRAAQRLKWEEVDVEDHNLDVSPSPPPPVQFIYAR